jgi:transcriptional regulator with XRE-family HTH domain
MRRLAEAPGTPAAPAAFGALLRHWRLARRMSQLALAVEAEVSARHLCFLETGRAHPSREMVQVLAGVLDVPLAERNALLLAAGYAPAYGQRGLDAPEVEHVRRAFQFVLRQQEPYPALVVDGGWDVVMRNEAAGRIFGLFFQDTALPPADARNAMRSVCHPEGLRRYIVNWEEFAGPLIQSIHREAAGGGLAITRLRDELLAYPGMPARWRTPDPGAPLAPVLTMRLRRGDLALAFFSTLTTLALPRDAGLEHLRIECFYPGDASTEEACRRFTAAS